jgi:hypothetical protein
MADDIDIESITKMSDAGRIGPVKAAAIVFAI